MTDQQAQQRLVGVVIDWLAGGAEAGPFVDRYWTTRRELLRANPGAFDGPVADVLSHIDVALHSYWPEPDSPGELGEPELRRELGELIELLRPMGFPLSE